MAQYPQLEDDDFVYSALADPVELELNLFFKDPEQARHQYDLALGKVLTWIYLNWESRPHTSPELAELIRQIVDEEIPFPPAWMKGNFASLLQAP